MYGSFLTFIISFLRMRHALIYNRPTASGWFLRVFRVPHTEPNPQQTERDCGSSFPFIKTIQLVISVWLLPRHISSLFGMRHRQFFRFSERILYHHVRVALVAPQKRVTRHFEI